MLTNWHLYITDDHGDKWDTYLYTHTADEAIQLAKDNKWMQDTDIVIKCVEMDKESLA